MTSWIECESMINCKSNENWEQIQVSELLFTIPSHLIVIKLVRNIIKFWRSQQTCHCKNCIIFFCFSVSPKKKKKNCFNTALENLCNAFIQTKHEFSLCTWIFTNINCWLLTTIVSIVAAKVDSLQVILSLIVYHSRSAGSIAPQQPAKTKSSRTNLY